MRKKKKTHTEAKMKKDPSERFTRLAAGLFSLATPPHQELRFHYERSTVGRGSRKSETWK